jgi:regulator of sigma E protease
VGKRIIVIAAGIVMNLLLAFVAAFALYAATPFSSARIGALTPGYPAEAAGLMPGDIITKVNGKHVVIAEDVTQFINANAGDPVLLTVKRDGKTRETTITPRFDEEYGRYMIGFSFNVMLGMFSKAPEGAEGLERAGFSETLNRSFGFCVSSVRSIYDFLGQLITRRLDPGQMSGPIGIIDFMGDVYDDSVATGDPWNAVWNIMMLISALSVNLAVFNFLPIPALDGGRIVFLIIEAVRGKPVNPEKEGIIHFAGLILLMILMVFVTYNDILKII